MSQTFDDPRLKAAVKRAWGDEKAPADLRARILAALDEEPDGSEEAPASAPAIAGRIGRSGGSWRLFVPLGPWAAAAVLLVSVGLVGFHFLRSSDGRDAPLPLAAAEPMLATHVGCCALPDHHFVPAPASGDFADAGKWLASRASVPVLSVAVGDGWTFCGAGPCPVGGQQSGHLLFKRGKQELSIFSLAAAPFHMGGKDEDYTASVRGHDLAGFTKDGGLYCVVGYDPDHAWGARDVQKLRDRLKSDFNSDAFAAGPPSLPRPTLASFDN